MRIVINLFDLVLEQFSAFGSIGWYMPFPCGTYPDRETPKYFNIPETETRRPAFLAFSALTVTSR